MNIVINASPIIFFAKLGIVQSLPDMFDPLVIPKGVRNEIVKGKDEAATWINDDGKPYIQDVGSVPDIIKAWDLGRGESQVLAFSQKNTNFIVGIDDKAARNCAKSLNLQMIGTLGLILLAQKQTIVEDATPYLYKLPELRLPN